MKYILLGLYPFIGTSLGASCVFILKNKINEKVERIILGFSSGIMLSALFFSLLIPSIELSTFLGNLRFIPSCVGVTLGILMFVLIDKIIHKYQKKQFLMPLVVTLHNIPEGMAVGVAIASLLQENILMTYASVFALSIGIAIQNIPEGAIISMALKSKGVSKFKSFLIGVASGAVEPIATFITILFTNMISTILPYALALSAGAMLYVIVEELIPSAYKENSKLLIISFMIGFLIMMILDLMLG